MDLTLTRTSCSKGGIFGKILDSKGNKIAFSLEHAYASGGSWTPKILNGSYTCVRGNHRLHGMDKDFETFEITEVKGHSNLLFHWGNYNKDSEGCVLVGASIVKDMVTNSRVTFAKFMALQDGLDRFQLTVK